MKSLTQHIQENLLTEAVKYTNTEVKGAIAYSSGKGIKDILDLSDEAKGYSYRLAKTSEFLTISYTEVNSILDNHVKSIRKQYSINESIQIDEAFRVCMNMKAMNPAQKLEIETMLLNDNAKYYSVDNLLYLDTSTICDSTKLRINDLLMH